MQDALWDFESDEGPGDGAARKPAPTPAPRRERPPGYRRPGLDHCPRCGQPVEVFAVAPAEGFDAAVPGEYPSARVPEDAASHLVRGRMWPGRDPGGWSRIRHRAVCPEEAMPEDPELLAMWRALRVRRRAKAEGRGNSGGGSSSSSRGKRPS